MNEPVPLHANGIHTYAFENEGVRVQIDRLHTGREDSLTGECTVRYIFPDTHLHQARLNLTSTTARASIARRLAQINPRTSAESKAE